MDAVVNRARCACGKPKKHSSTRCADCHAADMRAGRSPVTLAARRRESWHQTQGVKLLKRLGWTVYVLGGQGRATRQTAGIPDVFAVHAARGRALWWEVKAPGGKPRPEQVAFERLAVVAGLPYLRGTFEDLTTYLEG